MKFQQTLSYNISHEIICHNTLDFKTISPGALRFDKDLIFYTL